jgi:hypothetical protein
MRWPDIIEAVVGAISSDELLSQIIGENVFASTDRDLVVPSIAWTVISDVETERFNEITVQLDVFTYRDADLVAVERSLRFLFDHDLPVEIGGIRMWAQLARRSSMFLMEDSTRGSSTDYTFTPIRSRYLREES